MFSWHPSRHDLEVIFPHVNLNKEVQITVKLTEKISIGFHIDKRIYSVWFVLPTDQLNDLSSSTDWIDPCCVRRQTMRLYVTFSWENLEVSWLNFVFQGPVEITYESHWSRDYTVKDNGSDLPLIMEKFVWLLWNVAIPLLILFRGKIAENCLAQ